ncbi:MAG: hypothetical protein R3211_05610 [Balneolaceae bacterium]|nr:hypothetical protein [Balneolaceae bacterium]
MLSAKVKQRSLLVIRLLLGTLFLLSGVGKLISAGDARYLVELMATEVYWLIEYTDLIVYGTSVVELILAGFLLWGRELPWAFGGSILLLLGFTSVLGYFWLQGQSVESCGCFGAFGGGGGLEVTLIRNLVLIGMVIGGYLLGPANRKE